MVARCGCVENADLPVVHNCTLADSSTVDVTEAPAGTFSLDTIVSGAAGNLVSESPAGLLGAYPARALVRPRCRVYDAYTGGSQQSIAAATDVAVSFDSEEYDADDQGYTAFHSNVTNNSRMTNTLGFTALFTVGACITIDVDAMADTDDWYLWMRKNGSVKLVGRHRRVETLGTLARDTMSVETDVLLAANDYVEAVVRQTAAGAINLIYLEAMSPRAYLTYAGD